MKNVEWKRLSIKMKSTMHTDHGHIVWRTVYSPKGSSSHRTLIVIRRGKSPWTARGEGEGARWTSSQHFTGPVIGRTIYPVGTVAIT